MLSSFFKKEVIFSFSYQRAWLIVQYYTELPHWRTLIKDAIYKICFDNLYFDDYVPGPSDAVVQEIHIHAEIGDNIIEFLTQRHGFIHGHPNKSGEVLKQMNGDVFYKRFTEKQLHTFVEDLQKLKISPDTDDLLNSNLFNLKSFDDF